MMWTRERGGDGIAIGVSRYRCIGGVLNESEILIYEFDLFYPNRRLEIQLVGADNVIEALHQQFFKWCTDSCENFFYFDFESGDVRSQSVMNCVISINEQSPLGDDYLTDMTELINFKRRKLENDSVKRWGELSIQEQGVWDDYDKRIAPKIIDAALEKHDYTFIDLYQVLSVARLRCEGEKNPNGDKYQAAFEKGFGQFQRGSSAEKSAYSSGWGSLVSELTFTRIKDSDHSYHNALSRFDADKNWIQHPFDPSGLSLERLDGTFQQLISTDDFFKFIQISARIIYYLSNYPLILRGSAAVNHWLIDYIAKKRFDLPFNLNPLLYDWIAFFDTPEQYLGFYIISATAEYLKTIPVIYESDNDFFDSMLSRMIPDPNYSRNLQAREDAWQQITNYVISALEQLELTPMQRKYLESIQNGDVIFRKPSESIVKLVTDINRIDKLEDFNDEKLNQLIKDSGYPEGKLKELLIVRQNLSVFYLDAYNDFEKEKNLNEMMPDIQILNYLIPETIVQLRRVLNISNTEFELNTNHPHTVESLGFRQELIELKDDKYVKMFTRISLMRWEDLAHASTEILELLKPPAPTDNQELRDLKEHLQDALWSGGVRLQELLDLSVDDIQIIASPEALALYKENSFIRAKDILASFNASSAPGFGPM